MKDDSGSYAALTEQGSSASHMMAGKVLDVISNHQQAEDKQVTQYPLTTMSKWRTLLNDSNFRNWNARLFGFVYLDPVGQKFVTKLRNPCNLLERNLCGQPLVRIPLGAFAALF